MGKAAAWCAALFSPRPFGRYHLARFNRKGYISPSATIHHADLILGPHIFIGDNVVIHQYDKGGSVKISDLVSINRDCIIQTGEKGSISIGADTHIQVRCILTAFVSPIVIGSRVIIAPNCAFYSYNHSVAPDEPIIRQPLESNGGIFIDDDAWLGVGVIVLDGVRIGKGAVIGAGSVVTHDIPDGAIAFGNPAKVHRMRDDFIRKFEDKL